MKKHPEAVILFALLFAGWMGYLSLQAWKYRHPPVIVSRAQLLMSKYDVVADLATADGKPSIDVAIGEVLFADDDGGPKAGTTIKIWNIAECDGYGGPGSYLIPLTVFGGQYLVAALPFDPGRSSADIKPRIYPASDEVRNQIRELRK